MGVGAGAYLMLRYATKYSDMVDALILFGCTTRKCGWLEWGYKLYALTWLKTMGENTFYKDSFFRRWFSFQTISDNHNLMEFYDHELQRQNETNLWKFLQGYQVGSLSLFFRCYCHVHLFFFPSSCAHS